MKPLTKVILLSSLLSNVAFAGGIPVFDGIANTNSIVQWAEKIEQWASTVEHYKEELGKLERQIKATTGIRNVGDINVKDFIKDFKKIDLSIPSVEDLLSGKNGTKLLNKYGLKDSCSNFKHASLKEFKQICFAKITNNLSLIEGKAKVKSATANITKNIKGLANRIKNSDDIKTSQDIGNAVANINGQIEIINKKDKELEDQIASNEKILEAREELLREKINNNDINSWIKRVKQRKGQVKSNNNDGFSKG